MASYEIAIMLGIVGTAFLLFYASSLFDTKSGAFMQVFKIFFVLCGVAMMAFFIPTAEYTLMEANNGSTPPHMDGLSALIVTQIEIHNWIFYIFIGLFLCYIVYLVWRLATEKPAEPI